MCRWSLALAWPSGTAIKLTVWTGTQVPFGIRRGLAATFGIEPEQVRVIVPDTGSGYGGKHRPDMEIEAARLARAAGTARAIGLFTGRRVHPRLFPPGRRRRGESWRAG